MNLRKQKLWANVTKPAEKTIREARRNRDDGASAPATGPFFTKVELAGAGCPLREERACVGPKRVANCGDRTP